MSNDKYQIIGTFGGDVIIPSTVASPGYQDGQDLEIYGGTGDDTITTRVTYGAGYLNGEAGNDSITGNASDDTIYGGTGDDTLDGGLGGDIIDGGTGDDVLIGGSGVDTIDGGAGNDTLDYSNESLDRFQIDLATGISQYERVNTPSNNGTADIFSNIENVIGSTYDDEIIGNAEANRLDGHTGNDSIDGGAGADTVIGGDGNDTLNGGAGDDTLSGGAGDDTFDGGDGVDTLDYSLDGAESNGRVRVDLRDGTTRTTTGTGTLSSDFDNVGIEDRFSNIENVIGSNNADWLFGDDNGNVFHGGGGGDDIYSHGGDDTIDGGDGDDVLVGGSGDDVIIGGHGTDELWGDADNDVLGGGYGIDRIDGGDGFDYVSYNLAEGDKADNKRFDINLATGETRYGDANSTTFTGLEDRLYNIEGVIGSERGDVITGNQNGNVLRGGSGDDNLDGDAGGDILYGDHGHDRILGGQGNDIIYGGTGDDVLGGGAGIDLIDGGAGIDTLDFSLGGTDNNTRVHVDLRTGVTKTTTVAGTSASDFVTVQDTFSNIENVTGSSRADWIFGDGNDNVIHGREGADNVYAHGGDDELYGAFGDDTLVGGGGNDLISGGDNNDDLFGGDGNDTLGGGWGDDLIDGGDGIDFVHYDISNGDDNGYNRFDINLATGQTRIGYIDSVSFGEVQDTLLNIEGVVGSGRGDRITGDDNQQGNILLGGDGNDNINGGGGDDLLAGGLGNDTINGGAGIDTVDYNIDEGDQTDDLRFVIDLSNGSAGAGSVDGGGFGLATDTLSNIENAFGSTRNDIIVGDTGGNYLRGNAGNDVIFGRDGPDLLEGNEGNDILATGVDANTSTLDGGEGFDIAHYDIDAQNRLSSGYTEIDLAAGRTNVYNDDGTLRRIDNLIDIEGVIGSRVRDEIRGDDGNNVLFGGAGADTLYGGAGNDVLVGDAGNNTLYGGDGNDLLGGRNASQHIDGGDGIDTVHFDLAYNDSQYRSFEIDLEAGVYHTIGRDFNTGAINSRYNSGTLVNVENAFGHRNVNTPYRDPREAGDDLYGSSGDNVLGGGDGADRLEGRGGNDILYGERGNDRIFGDDGNDLLYGGEGNDVIDGGDGIDTVSFADQSLNGGRFYRVDLETADSSYGFTSTGQIVSLEDRAIRNIENIIGSNGSDFLHGDAGHNVIVGGSGGDTLTGRGGNDILIANQEDAAGDAQDTLNGGEGNDILLSDGGTATRIANVSGDILNGGAGDDLFVVQGGYNFEVYGGTGSDYLTFGDTIGRGASSDTGLLVDLEGGTIGYRTVVDGDITVDTVASVQGIELLQGTINSDEFVGTDVGEVLHGGFGGQDVINAGGGSDVIIERGDNSTIRAGSGDDTIFSNGANTFVDGGTGIDTALFDDAVSSVHVDLSAGNVASSTGQTVVNVENVVGSVYSDTLTGNDESNVIGSGFNGGVGDTINAGGGDDQIHVSGGTGNIVHGGGGDDLISVGGSVSGDFYGDAGNDTFLFAHDSAESGSVRVFGGAGQDSILLQGHADEYSRVDNGSGVITLTHAELGTIELTDVEELRFTDSGASDIEITNGTGSANLSVLAASLEQGDYIVIYNVPADVTITNTDAVRGQASSNGTYSFTIPVSEAGNVQFSTSGTHASLDGIAYAPAVGLGDLSLDPALRAQIGTEVVIATVEDSALADADTQTDEINGVNLSGNVGESASAHVVISTDSTSLTATADAVAQANGDVVITNDEVRIAGVASAEASAQYVTVQDIGGFATVTTDISASADVSASGEYYFGENGISLQAAAGANAAVTYSNTFDFDHFEILLEAGATAEADAFVSAYATNTGVGLGFGAGAAASLSATVGASTENDYIVASASVEAGLQASAGADLDSNLAFEGDNFGGNLGFNASASAGTYTTYAGSLGDGTGISQVSGDVTTSTGPSIGAGASVNATYQDGVVNLGINDSGLNFLVAGVYVSGDLQIDLNAAGDAYPLTDPLLNAYGNLGETIGSEVDSFFTGDFVDAFEDEVASFFTDTISDAGDVLGLLF